MSTPAFSWPAFPRLPIPIPPLRRRAGPPPPVPPAAAIPEPVRRLETALAGAALAAAGHAGPRLTDPLLDRLFRHLADRHPRLRDGLRALPAARILVDPVDQPVALVLTVGPQPGLALAPDKAIDCQAAIRGPLAALIDLAEGRIDGDALFFRRTLAIEGDTALVVAVRNGLDGEDIDLPADLAAIAGPLAALLPRLRRDAGRAATVLTAAHAALLAPVTDRLDRLERRLAAPPAATATPFRPRRES